MKKSIVLLSFLLVLFSCQKKVLVDLTDYVDPMIGTDAHGHTFPGATTPFGMVQLSPSNDFKSWDWCSGYHYSDSIIKGFAHNHISGAGLSGLGDILIMPTMGKKTTKSGSDELVDDSYRSRFSHKTERARAGYYAVTLEDYGINVELTATPRTGFHKYTFNKSGVSDIVIDPTHGVMERAAETSIEVVSNSEIRGYKSVGSGDKYRYAYFSAKFSKPFEKATITDNDKEIEEQKLTALKAKGYVSFNVEEGEQIEVSVTLSPIDYDGVDKNFKTEAQGKSFDDVLKETTEAWNKVLNKITISETSSDAKKRTFYTAMYHAFISPNIISDVDGRYAVEGKQYKFNSTQYSNYSTWDTYRALHPLLTIIEQKETSKMINSLISRDSQAGVGQPVWELLGFDNGCMIGYTTSSVIGDAVLKNIDGINYEEAFKSMYKAASDLSKHSAVYDVSGLEDYINYGYVTGETGSSVSKTTEYNYHDFVIAEVAKKLGKTKEAEEFHKRSIGYRAMFNPEDGYLYPVYSTGEMHKLNLSSWDDLIPNYVSGNIWAYSAYTPHDMAGVIQLHGGKEKYATWLDKVFSDTSTLGGAQHVDISGFIGKYGHGDEPGHQMPYLYNFVGQPWKSQKYVNEVVTTMYSDKPDGLINNEDLGQMSAWYIFSTLGFYPVAPASLNYQLGAPYYESATVNLENGNTFTVKAHNLSDANFYVQSVKLNGEIYNKTFISHDDIMNGGVLEFTMGEAPNKVWGSLDESTSIGAISAKSPEILVKATASPYDENNSFFFSEKHIATLKSNDSDADIYYTTDGSTPTLRSNKYKQPFEIKENCILKAAAIKQGLNISKIYEKPLFKSIFPLLKEGYPKITMNNWSEPNYGKEDGRLLFDEVVGSSSYGDGKWTAIKDTFDVGIDLGQNHIVENISVGVLTDIGSWIFPTKSIEVYGGNSNQSLNLIGKLNLPKADKFPKEVNRYTLPVKKGQYKYLRVKVNPYGVAPEWHGAFGQKVWLFIDEIMVF
ncbi:GH92 family glycosyl hydrolase [Flavivirga eckloniae]|uniref:Glycoside hydrolase family 92 protein n=1 Tax=Flavivirga eckloniae TaxID=1803846 RepID=A0A2K9PSN3_9FLAO|nr:GH92 family glycosyl hydrolase [Flavivirga eckloniae]AUP80065.1 glycoside hydrolase family 92 protein [Flavivirga eckloniae]